MCKQISLFFGGWRVIAEGFSDCRSASQGTAGLEFTDKPIMGCIPQSSAGAAREIGVVRYIMSECQ